MGGARGKIILVEPKEHGDAAKKRKARVARLRTSTEESSMTSIPYNPVFPPTSTLPTTFSPSYSYSYFYSASISTTVNSTIRYSPSAMPRFLFLFFNHTRLQVTLGVSVHLLADCPEQAIPVQLYIDNVEPL